MPVKYLDMPLSTDELACIYSALILADDDIPITADKLETLIKAADVDVESIWPSMFAKALQGQDIRKMLFECVAKGTAGPAAVGQQQQQAAGEQQPAGEQQQKQEEPEEDSEDDDMGLSLFD